jgi:hypothetical protein
MSNVIYDQRTIYDPDDLWLREGKRICRKFLWKYRKFEWSRTTDIMIRELLSVQRSKGTLLGDELVQHFLLRLAYQLNQNGKLKSPEHEQFCEAIETISQQKDLSQGITNYAIDSDIAKALILKSLLEIGRKRSRANKQISVDKLLSTDLLRPLDLGAPPSDTEVFWTGEIEKSEHIRDCYEFHCAVALHYAMLDYRRAINELSLKYKSLRIPFEVLSVKEQKTEREQIFTSQYPNVRDSFSVDWKLWL